MPTLTRSSKDPGQGKIMESKQTKVKDKEEKDEQGDETDTEEENVVQFTLSDVMSKLEVIQTKQDSFQKDLADMKKDMKQLRKEMTKLIDERVEKATGPLKRNIQKIEEKMGAFEDTLGRLEQASEAGVAARVDAAEPTADPEKTVVMLNVPEVENDDVSLDVKVQDILTALGDYNGQAVKDSVTVVQTKRIPSRNQYPGLVKVAFDCKNSKIIVLKTKQKLKNHNVLGNIWIRSSKTHAERLIELNCKKLLNLLPGGSEYTVTGSGKIAEKGAPEADDNIPNRGNGRGGYRGRGNQGAGRRGRGGRYNRNYGRRGARGQEDSGTGLTPV